MEETNSNSFLEVQTVGSYSVSIAKSLDDLHRIDPSVFKLEDNIAEVLSAVRLVLLTLLFQ